MSLYQRLALSLSIVFILIISVVVCWTGSIHQQSKQHAEQELHLDLATHLVNDNPLLAEGVYDYEGLANLFHTLMVLGPAFEFYYLDPEGHILTYSADPDKIKREKIAVDPIRTLIDKRGPLPILGEDPRHPTNKKIFSAAPVYKDQQLQGYLYMIIGGENADTAFSRVSQHERLLNMASVAIASVLFLLFVLLLLFRAFTHPLKALCRAVEKVNHDNLAHVQLSLPTYESSGHNEVSSLSRAFEKMLDKIQTQYQQLQLIDQHRRVLLADLSHDLRTPLANLQGYVETLSLRRDNLTNDEHQAFLDICLKNANNLKKLIDQIFELAYLEGDHVTIQKEVFPLGELLQDVMAKFTLHANSRDVSLHIEPLAKDYLVQTDIGKVERVLTNLIDNAIRHTPKNGKVTVSVSVAPSNSQSIRVNITDNGVGISQQEIAYIFDARYRATNTLEDKQSHAGLGLAICKKLIQLLNSDLTVKSELGKGTCFSFELNVAKDTSPA
ncbi:HAMP domain-containing histidine kinase [Aestuariibacter sp. AA17]|uniref:histidine kinase n=1 Tax=Fluctibacter corallii TaxID=2984329 RepID=A0ABT3A454_9ALTE|nr:HAMP domain-containing sensor histidine kinase [Aestuariibacter sp. AA17]MCV2883382.1 HAMP domain-containing histidine kinase [Aestuariibacter sp. AA17]